MYRLCSTQINTNAMYKWASIEPIHTKAKKMAPKPKVIKSRQVSREDRKEFELISEPEKSQLLTELDAEYKQFMQTFQTTKKSKKDSTVKKRLEDKKKIYESIPKTGNLAMYVKAVKSCDAHFLELKTDNGLVQLAFGEKVGQDLQRALAKFYKADELEQENNT